MKNLRPVPEEGSFVIFWVFLIFQCKKIVNKRVSRSNFSFINLSSMNYFWKFLKKHSHLWCSGFLRNRKLVHLDMKNVPCFIHILLHNSVNLVLSCEKKIASSKKKRLKLKQYKKAHICGIWCLILNRQVKNPRAVSEEKPFVIFFSFCYFLMQKHCQ